MISCYADVLVFVYVCVSRQCISGNWERYTNVESAKTIKGQRHSKMDTEEEKVEFGMLEDAFAGFDPSKAENLFSALATCNVEDGKGRGKGKGKEPPPPKDPLAEVTEANMYQKALSASNFVNTKASHLEGVMHSKAKEGGYPASIKKQGQEILEKLQTAQATLKTIYVEKKASLARVKEALAASAADVKLAQNHQSLLAKMG